MQERKKQETPNFPLEARIQSCQFYLTTTTKQGEVLSIELYRFTDGLFLPEDINNPLFTCLATNYGNQLLFPLFQELPPYSRLNRLRGNEPRFTPEVASEEVAKYLGIKDPSPDRIFVLFANPFLLPFSDLIGYAIGYGLKDRGGIEALIREKFLPGVVGTDQNDRFELTEAGKKIVADPTGRCAYYNGVGITSAWQGKGLGLLIMREFLEACQKKGYDSIVTRVVRGARNWSLFAGIDDEPSTALKGTTKIATYSNPLFDREKDYRAIFLTDINQATVSLEEIIGKKMTFRITPSSKLSSWRQNG